MKSVFLFGTAALLVAVVGCTPKLASRELGERDQDWNDYLKPIYPSWKAPETLPPAVNPNSELLPPPEPEADDALPVATNLPPPPPLMPEGTVTTEAIVIGAPEVSASPTAEAPAAVVVQEETFEEYVVQKNDSLSKIAKKFYGDGRKYYRIQKANPSLLANPNRLLPGSTIRIPVSK